MNRHWPIMPMTELVWSPGRLRLPQLPGPALWALLGPPFWLRPHVTCGVLAPLLLAVLCPHPVLPVPTLPTPGDLSGHLLAYLSLSPVFVIVGFVTLIIFKRELHTVSKPVPAGPCPALRCSSRAPPQPPRQGGGCTISSWVLCFPFPASPFLEVCGASWLVPGGSLVGLGGSGRFHSLWAWVVASRHTEAQLTTRLPGRFRS